MFNLDKFYFHFPRFDDESSSPTLRSPKFAPSPPNNYYKGWWTFPYFSCSLGRWLVSYSIAIPPSGRHGLRGFISIDIDVTTLRVNQCEAEPYHFGSRRQKQQQLQQQQRLTTRRSPFLASNRPVGGLGASQDEATINDLQAFHSSHKCHRESMMVSDSKLARYCLRLDSLVFFLNSSLDFL